MVADVESHGWHCVTVPADTEGPGFTYSIGLTENYGHPEVIVIGLSVENGPLVINAIGEVIRDDRVRFHAYERADSVIEGYPVVFLPVEPRFYEDFAGLARWFYSGDGFELLQCAWPDVHGRFPWDLGARATFQGMQPLLGRPPS